MQGRANALRLRGLVMPRPNRYRPPCEGPQRVPPPNRTPDGVIRPGPPSVREALMQGRIEDVSNAEERPRALRIQPSGIEGTRPESARAQYRRLYRLIAATDILSGGAALLVASWVQVGLALPSGDALTLVLGSPV